MRSNLLSCSESFLVFHWIILFYLTIMNVSQSVIVIKYSAWKAWPRTLATVPRGQKAANTGFIRTFFLRNPIKELWDKIKQGGVERIDGRTEAIFEKTTFVSSWSKSLPVCPGFGLFFGCSAMRWWSVGSCQPVKRTSRPWLPWDFSVWWVTSAHMHPARRWMSFSRVTC